MTYSPPVRLGWDPIEVTVVLSKGGGWNVVISPEDPPAPQPNYPAGTIVEAKLYPAGTDVTQPIAQWTVVATWPAVVTTDTIRWAVAAAQTDPIPAGTLVRVFLTLPGSPPYQYLSGTVERDD